MNALYTASATATGDGRNGHVRSSDGVLDFDLAIPKEMGGPGGALTNPEQLFAAGYGACFQGALSLVAKKHGIDASGSELEIAVGFGPEGESFAITADITARIPGVDDAKAQELVEAAHEVCPYSNATRGNIEVKLTVV